MTEIIYTPLRLDAALYRIEASMHISDEDAPIVAHAYRILQARIEALEREKKILRHLLVFSGWADAVIEANLADKEHPALAKEKS